AAGRATFTIDGESYDAPAGTYVFVPDPASKRHAVAVEPGTTVLSFGGPPTFQPSAWEWAFQAGPLVRSDPRRARRILAEGLQDPKLADDAFAELCGDELSERGYDAASYGEATWNGVAILSRVGLEDVVRGLDGAPGFPHPEARAVAASCAGVRVTSVYVPNGRVPESEHYQYKLNWLRALREAVAAGPEAQIVCGDMNIAP